MKLFEAPIIEVITFTTESIMDESMLPGADDRLPWN